MNVMLLFIQIYYLYRFYIKREFGVNGRNTWYERVNDGGKAEDPSVVIKLGSEAKVRW